jgi:hypothetical protein
MKMTGAQILLECLKREEVKHIFGYPGGVVLDIYDELTRHPDIKHILVRHEQAAAHAADGYARASSQVGVALVTSGPGATNTVTGIASAYMDSIPIVVLTGQVPTALIGNDAFQEVDIVGITRPCTKHNYLVKRVEDAILKGGLQPSSCKELSEEWSEEEEQVLAVLEHLVHEGVLVKIKSGMYFHRVQFDHLREKLITHLKRHQEITTPQFKELTGVSRKYTIPLIEYFDQSRLTLRLGEKRVLRAAKEV